jgi:hypothetical protein
LSINIRNDTIVHVDNVKYLGVLIDEKLNFEKHINYIRSKISSILGILHKLCNILPINAKKLIYYSLIHSHIAYACEMWEHSTSTRIEKLFILQKKAVKVMCGLSYRAHSHPIYYVFCIL